MDDHTFLNSLEDLTGKTAVVTGGGGGIGLETTIYLAAKGCTVYAASRNKEKSEKGIEEANRRLSILVPHEARGEIKFHHLDLSSIKAATESAKELESSVEKINIIVANAGISMQHIDELGPDGWEKTMATNHLGHFAFVTTVLDTIQSTATTNGEARIVVVSSEAVKFAASGIDYKALTTRIPGDGKSLFDLKAAMLRYANSKLANIYFAEELDRRLRAESVENVYVDSCHPGAAGATGIGDDVVHGMLLVLLKNAIKGLLKAVANTNVDSARTQVFLAASKKVRDEDIHGQFWWPQWNWKNCWIGCQKDSGQLPAVAKDRAQMEELWTKSEEAIKQAGVV